METVSEYFTSTFIRLSQFREISDTDLKDSPEAKLVLHYHLSRVHDRLGDLELIYNRISTNSQLLRHLNTQLPNNFKKNSDLGRENRIDMETIFFIGTTFLDQIIFMIEAALRTDHSENFNDLTYDLLQGRNHPLKFLWPDLRLVMLKIFSQFSIYRNKFVAHQDVPIQYSYSSGVD